MTPIEITQKKGYEILRYNGGHWKARKSGISGEIFGVGKESRAFASPPASLNYSSISSGSKAKGYFSPKDKNGNLSLNVFMLALLTAPEKPEFIRESLLNAINEHPSMTWKFENNYDETSSSYGSAYNQFEDYAASEILDWIRIGGSSALKNAANLLEKIEKKRRRMEKSETDFTDAVSEAATLIFEVPTQKVVRELWIKKQSGRNEKQFRDVRDRLEFDWLPTATRGKDAH